MLPDDISTQRSGVASSGVGYNWLWFGPFALAVLIFVEQHTIGYAWIVGKLALQRWSWAVFLSPSAAFCFAVTMTSITMPLQGVFLAKAWLADRTQPWKRVYPVVGLLLLLLAFPFATDMLIWGSFPFTYDSAGVGHLRLIPFIPWPSGGYGAL